MALKYFYKHQAEQYSFIRIPKALITDDVFKTLSIEAKLLYGMLLDRMTNSTKNRWIDDKNRVFIIYPLLHIQQELDISKKKAVAILSELEEIGLIERIIRGQGLPSIIYIKSFLLEQGDYVTICEE